MEYGPKESPLVTDTISRKFDDFFALDSVSLRLNPGEIFGLLGPNGAGKTTFISIITSLLAPTSGNGSVFGYDIQKESLSVRKKIGFVPQEVVSHGFFSVRQILQFHSGYYGIRKNGDRIDYLLHKLALFDHRKKLVSQLSGGMKRRLLIAKALVHDPPFLLLDEPTAGVDVELRNALWEFVRELNRAGQTILLTTHYLNEAEELCDRVGVLSQGKLIALDETRHLIKKMTCRRVNLVMEEDWKGDVKSDDAQIDGNRIRICLSHRLSVGEYIKKIGVPLEQIKDISVTEGDLEEAFIKLLQQDSNANGKIQ